MVVISLIISYKTYRFFEGSKHQCSCGFWRGGGNKKSHLLDKKSQVDGQKIASQWTKNRKWTTCYFLSNCSECGYFYLSFGYFEVFYPFKFLVMIEYSFYFFWKSLFLLVCFNATSLVNHSPCYVFAVPHL